MKQNNCKIDKQVLTARGILFLLAFSILPINLFGADLLVIATFKSGDVFFERGEKDLPVTKGQTFEKKDRIKTKNGIVDLQVGPNIVVRVGKYSSMQLSSLIGDKENSKVELDLNSGSAFTKVFSKLNKGSDFKIVSPTKTAGVRGTQFLIQEGNESEPETEKEAIQDGIYVSEGVVEVKPNYAKRPIIVNAGEELLTSQKKLKAQVLDSYIKEKLKILQSLNVMQEANFKNLQEQYQKNKELLKK